MVEDQIDEEITIDEVKAKFHRLALGSHKYRTKMYRKEWYPTRFNANSITKENETSVRMPPDLLWLVGERELHTVEKLVTFKVPLTNGEFTTFYKVDMTLK